MLQWSYFEALKNGKMKIIVRTCPERIEFWKYLKSRLPRGTIFVCDGHKNAMFNFLNSLEIAGADPCLHLEDDIILTKNFIVKINAVVDEHPADVIQFFSMRKADLETGSRYDPGRRFMMNQCFYLPAGMSLAIREYYETWVNINGNKIKNPTGYDILMADYFHANKMKYWIHCPSLVQHRHGTSLINKKRSNFMRESMTFIDPDTE